MSDANAATEDAVLPPGWVKTIDSNSGRAYYYNKRTKKTSWKFPKADDAAADAPPAAAVGGSETGGARAADDDTTIRDTLPAISPSPTATTMWSDAPSPATAQPAVTDTPWTAAPALTVQPAPAAKKENLSGGGAGGIWTAAPAGPPERPAHITQPPAVVVPAASAAAPSATTDTARLNRITPSAVAPSNSEPPLPKASSAAPPAAPVPAASAPPLPHGPASIQSFLAPSTDLGRGFSFRADSSADTAAQWLQRLAAYETAQRELDPQGRVSGANDPSLARQVLTELPTLLHRVLSEHAAQCHWALELREKAEAEVAAALDLTSRAADHAVVREMRAAHAAQVASMEAAHRAQREQNTAAAASERAAQRARLSALEARAAVAESLCVRATQDAEATIAATVARATASAAEADKLRERVAALEDEVRTLRHAAQLNRAVDADRAEGAAWAAERRAAADVERFKRRVIEGSISAGRERAASTGRPAAETSTAAGLTPRSRVASGFGPSVVPSTPSTPRRASTSLLMQPAGSATLSSSSGTGGAVGVAPPTTPQTPLVAAAAPGSAAVVPPIAGLSAVTSLPAAIRSTIQSPSLASARRAPPTPRTPTPSLFFQQQQPAASFMHHPFGGSGSLSGGSGSFGPSKLHHTPRHHREYPPLLHQYQEGPQYHQQEGQQGFAFCGRSGGVADDSSLGHYNAATPPPAASYDELKARLQALAAPWA